MVALVVAITFWLIICARVLLVSPVKTAKVSTQRTPLLINNFATVKDSGLYLNISTCIIIACSQRTKRVAHTRVTDRAIVKTLDLRICVLAIHHLLDATVKQVGRQ